MTSVDHSDPVELRVLSVLTSGAAAAWTVAQEVGEPESVVEPVLERAVDDAAVVRLDLAGSPVYSLTSKGLQALGREPVVADVAPDAAAVGSSAAPASLVAPVPAAPQLDGATVASSPAREVTWRHVWYAAGYLLVGLFLLRFAPAVGVLAILGGIVLGGFALWPRWRSDPADLTTR